MKSREESLERVKGLFNITITPFSNDLSLDKSALSDNIERVLSLGYDGLLIGGTYGEFATMSPDERADMFKTVMDIAGDRVPVLLCTADSNTRVIEDLTVLASELGGLPMVMPPYVSEVTNEQIVSYFEKISPISKTGIMIYNAPGVGITLPFNTIEQLAGIAGMVALKQGDLNPTVVDQLASSVVGRIRVLAASDLVFLGPVASGFDGFSSTNSCALPETIMETYKSLMRGDVARAHALHRSWYGFRALARSLGQPQSTKALMTVRGWEGGKVRSPLLDLTSEEVEKIGRSFEAIVRKLDGEVELH